MIEVAATAIFRGFYIILYSA